MLNGLWRNRRRIAVARQPIVFTAICLILFTPGLSSTKAQVVLQRIELHNVTTNTSFCGGGSILSADLRFVGASGNPADPLDWTLRRRNHSQNSPPVDLNFNNTGADLGGLIPLAVDAGAPLSLNAGDIVEVYVFWSDDPSLQSRHLFMRCSPAAVHISSTLQDALTNDLDANGNVDPGDGYTLNSQIIESAGSTGGAITLTIPLASSLSFAPGSIRTTPIARDDHYKAIGNATLQVSAPGLFANDNDPDGRPGLSVEARTNALSFRGGQVTIGADGSFVYSPPTGFEGEDSFEYAIIDSEGNRDRATVRLRVSELVWFIDNTAAGGGDGRMSTPFNSLGAFNAINDGIGKHPADGQKIFLFEGAGAYTGGIVLRDGQQLIGQGIDLLVNGLTITSATARPVLSNATGASVMLGANNSIRGLDISSAGGAGISGTNFGTCTLGSIDISATGHPALHLQNGSLNATCGSVSSLNSATAGIHLSNVNGTFSATGGSISGAAGTAFNVDQGSADIRYDGTIDNDAGRALSISNRSGGRITFNGLITDDDPDGNANTGVLLQNNSGGAEILCKGGLRVVNSASTALQLSANSGATFGFTDIEVDNSGSNQTGITASGGGSLSTTGGTIHSGSATALDLDGMTLGMTLASVTCNGAATGIDISNMSGSFSITGRNAQAGSGGRIANITNRGISCIAAENISLNYIDFVDACTANGSSPCTNSISAGSNAGCNAPLHFDNCSNVSLNNLDIDGSAQNGINCWTVTNLSIKQVNIVDAANESFESGMKLFNLFGTCRIDSSSVDTCAGDHVRLHNDNSTQLVVTFANCSFTNSSQGFGIQTAGRGNSRMDITVEDSEVGNNFSTGINMQGSDDVTASGGAFNFYVRRNNIHHNGAAAIDLNFLGQSPASFEVVDNGTAVNPIVFHGSSVININQGRNGSPPYTDAEIRGLIRGNYIGSGANTSGTSGGSGIRVVENQSGTMILLIDSNTVRGWPGLGIYVLARDNANAAGSGDSDVDVTIVDNVIKDPHGAFPIAGIAVEAGATSNAFELHNICATIEGNEVTVVNPFEAVVEVFQRFNTTVQLFKSTSSSNDPATILNDLNTISGSPATDAIGTIGIVTTACDTP